MGRVHKVYCIQMPPWVFNWSKVMDYQPINHYLSTVVPMLLFIFPCVYIRRIYLLSTILSDVYHANSTYYFSLDFLPGMLIYHTCNYSLSLVYSNIILLPLYPYNFLFAKKGDFALYYCVVQQLGNANVFIK